MWVVIGEVMNIWGIPEWLEREVRERDKTCVYCGIQMIEKMLPGGPSERCGNVGAHYQRCTYCHSGEYSSVLRYMQFKQRGKEPF